MNLIVILKGGKSVRNYFKLLFLISVFVYLPFYVQGVNEGLEREWGESSDIDEYHGRLAQTPAPNQDLNGVDDPNINQTPGVLEDTDPDDPAPGEPTPGDPAPGEPTPGDPTPGEPTPDPDPDPDPDPAPGTPVDNDLGAANLTDIVVSGIVGILIGSALTYYFVAPRRTEV